MLLKISHRRKPKYKWGFILLSLFPLSFSDCTHFLLWEDGYTSISGYAVALTIIIITLLSIYLLTYSIISLLTYFLLYAAEYFLRS